MNSLNGLLASIVSGVQNKRRTRQLLAVLSVLAACCASANALTIIPTYDPSITTNANSAGIQAAINNAINLIDSEINNNVTVTINFGGITNGLGQSLSSFYVPTYTQYRNALATQQVLSPNDTLALASLPASNPVNATNAVLTTAPLLRALGFNAPAAVMGISTNAMFDSVIQFNFAFANLTRPGSNVNNYDLQATAEHEINEALGIGGAGSAIVTNAGALAGPVGPMDLFRYSAAGSRSFTTSTNAVSYFSINGGTNKLVNFNQGFGGDSDYGDWGNGNSPAQGVGNNPQQVQDAFGTPGTNFVDNGVNEITALDVVGWNVPEPSTVMLVGVGLLGLFSLRRRKA